MKSSVAGAAPHSPAPPHLVRSVGAGILCGFLAIVQSAGFGLLLLVGGAQSLAPAAIGMALFSTAVMAFIAALTSSTPGVVAIAQGIPIAALTAGVAHILEASGGAANQPAASATVVMFVALASLTIGLVCLLIGTLKAGRFIRFVPFPVMGGFLAGSGWLIFTGGVGIVAGHPLTLADLGRVTDPGLLTRLCMTAGFLALVAVLRRQLPINFVLPGASVVAIVLFAVGMFATGATSDEARAAGWLVDVAGEGALWPPISPQSVGLVNWDSIAGALIHLPVVVVLTVIAVLMNAAGIELDIKRDVDLDRELRSVGLQNLVGGAGGGMPGFQSVSLTTLTSRLGASSPIVGMIVSGFAVAALMFGEMVLSLVPTPLLGGLLVWVGLSLLIAWLVSSYPRLTRWEYGVIVLIFAVIVFVGFAAGILVGLIAAAVLFAFEYSRVEIVRHVLTGRDYQSSHDNSEERRGVLQTDGEAILIVQLQGFLFFGTADRMRKRIGERIRHPEGKSIRYLVVDFRRVTGVDSSAVMSFTRLSQMSSPERCVVVLCGMSGEVRKAVGRGNLEIAGGDVVRFERDLDHGLEWCENDLIARVAPAIAVGAAVPIIDLLSSVLKDRALAESILPYLDRVEVPAGEKLITQGAPSKDVYFIEAGRAAVEVENKEGANTRLATVGQGTIAGEMAFYGGRPRSASVIAETRLVAWRLSAEQLARLRQDAPDTVIDFHHGMAAVLADRLSATNRLVRLLAD